MSFLVHCVLKISFLYYNAQTLVYVGVNNSMKFLQMYVKNFLIIFLPTLMLASSNIYADIGESLHDLKITMQQQQLKELGFIPNSNNQRSPDIEFRADGRMWDLVNGDNWDNARSKQLTYVPRGQSLQDHTELFTLIVQDNLNKHYPTLVNYLNFIDRRNQSNYKSVNRQILARTPNVIRYRVVKTGYRGDATGKLIYQTQGKIIQTKDKIYLVEYTAIVNEVPRRQIDRSTIMINSFKIVESAH